MLAQGVKRSYELSSNGGIIVDVDGYDVKTGEHRQTVSESIFPPLSGWLLYFLVSVMILILVNFRVLWRLSINHVLGPSGGVDSIIHDSVLNPIFNFADKLNRPLLMLFWGLIGLVVYFFIHGFERLLSAINLQFRKSGYLQGGVKRIHNYWSGTIRDDFIFVTILIFWLLFFMFYVNAALPWFSKLLLTGVYTPISHLKLLAEVLLGLIGNTICIYLVVLITKLLHNSWSEVRS